MKLSKLYPRFVFVLILISCSLISCKNSVSGEEEHHSEPQGFQLILNGDVIVEKLPNQPLINDFPALSASIESDTIEVWFYDFEEHLFQPDDAEETLKLEVENPQLLQAIPIDQSWAFTLKPLKEGSTTFTFYLMHESHPDFTSAPITVNINDAVN